MYVSVLRACLVLWRAEKGAGPLGTAVVDCFKLPYGC